jgi:hypothetical protein
MKEINLIGRNVNIYENFNLLVNKSIFIDRVMSAIKEERFVTGDIIYHEK